MSGWVGIIFAGLAGGLAALLASLIVKNRKEKRGIYTGTFLLLFIVINLGMKYTIVPIVDDIVIEHQAGNTLQKIAVYQLIRKYHPDMYQSFLMAIKNGIKNGEDSVQVAAKLRPSVIKIMEMHMSTASDDAVLGMFTVVVEQIDILCGKDPDACYQLLFDPAALKVDLRKYFDTTMRDSELKAMTEVIRTSAEQPRPIPDEKEISAPLEQVQDDLYSKFGEDVLLVSNPTKPGVDRKKICCITGAFYRSILALPKDQASRVLRFITKES